MRRARITRGVRNARQAILWPLKMCMIMAVDESERSLLIVTFCSIRLKMKK